jgi:hypothetical protein
MIRCSTLKSTKFTHKFCGRPTKSQWAFQQKAENNIIGWSANHVAGTSAIPTVTVSGGTDEPATKFESSFE